MLPAKLRMLTGLPNNLLIAVEGTSRNESDALFHLVCLGIKQGASNCTNSMQRDRCYQSLDAISEALHFYLDRTIPKASST